MPVQGRDIQKSAHVEQFYSIDLMHAFRDEGIRFLITPGGNFVFYS